LDGCCTSDDDDDDDDDDSALELLCGVSGHSVRLSTSNTEAYGLYDTRSIGIKYSVPVKNTFGGVAKYLKQHYQ
jgi:hypothetical protein